MSTTVVAPTPSATVELSTLPSSLEASFHLQITASEDMAQPADAQRVFQAPPPATLTNTTRLLVTSLLVFANLIQFISNSVTLAGGIAISADFGRTPTEANWMAASYALTQGAFVLITGRLGAIYGYQRMVLIGCFIFAVFSLANGFSKTYDTFVTMRALTGVGGGIFMPNAVATITSMVPPGRLRNVFMGFFAASPPLGGMLGALLVGVFTTWADWSYLFVLIAGFTAVSIGWLWYLLPPEQPVDEHGKLDIVGSLLGLGSLLLFSIAWKYFTSPLSLSGISLHDMLTFPSSQAPSVGWDTPYEIAVLIISVLLFCSFLVWEQRVATDPIMPLTIFRAPTFTALICVVLLGYMGFGIALWYSIIWQQQLRDASVMDVAYHFIPFGIGSVVAVFIAAWLIPRVAAQWIVAVGVGVVLIGNALLATMPERQTYWAQVFPATLLIGFCPDFVYVAAQLVASNSVGRKQQGVASSLIGTLNTYGISVGIGFAATIESELNKGEASPIRGYRAALWFGGALAVLGLVLNFAFVRMPKDDREGWDESLEEDGADGDAVTTGIDRRVLSTA